MSKTQTKAFFFPSFFFQSTKTSCVQLKCVRRSVASEKPNAASVSFHTESKAWLQRYNRSIRNWLVCAHLHFNLLNLLSSAEQTASLLTIVGRAQKVFWMETLSWRANEGQCGLMPQDQPLISLQPLSGSSQLSLQQQARDPIIYTHTCSSPFGI